MNDKCTKSDGGAAPKTTVGKREPYIVVDALDHVHFFAADPAMAARWYIKVLGLISRDRSGIEYLSSADGQFCASILQGTPPSNGDHTAAFRVSGENFIRFGTGLPHCEVAARDGSPLTPSDVVDHEHAFSFYFKDPDGNHLELTTYDLPTVHHWLTSMPVDNE